MVGGQADRQMDSCVSVGSLWPASPALSFPREALKAGLDLSSCPPRTVLPTARSPHTPRAGPPHDAQVPTPLEPHSQGALGNKGRHTSRCPVARGPLCPTSHAPSRLSAPTAELQAGHGDDACPFPQGRKQALVKAPEGSTLCTQPSPSPPHAPCTRAICLCSQVGSNLHRCPVGTRSHGSSRPWERWTVPPRVCVCVCVYVCLHVTLAQPEPGWKHQLSPDPRCTTWSSASQEERVTEGGGGEGPSSGSSGLAPAP